MTDLDDGRPPLPLPGRARWQPLRAGLVDVFLYDVEEFRFRDGHLLLRGNNGTGKSKVLALLLPFLLDGEVTPTRVEPDGDPKKRMEWNLLLDDAHEERTGYAWIEFGRLDGERPRYTTLGCGLKAVRHRGAPTTWFFVTPQRVGEDLHLAPGRRALTRERLGEALADGGRRFDTARSYRVAVDEALFGLGDRYDALVDLLVQLRQPQLSKRPDTRLLSRALSEALPPLDPDVLADTAETFRSLEEERDGLAAATEARDAAVTFLEHYRRYAQVATRRRAAATASAQYEYSKARARLAAAGEARVAAAAREVEVSAALEAAERDLDDARVREQALQASPEMRSARALERADADVVRAERERDRLRQERAQAEADLAAAERSRDGATGRADAAGDAVREGARSTRRAAATAGVDDRHTDAMAPLDLTGAAVAEPEVVRQTRAAVGRVRDAREEHVDHVSGLAAAADIAEERATRARRDADRAAAAVDVAAGRHDEADAAFAAAGTALREGVAAALHAATELRVDAAGVDESLAEWVATLDGVNPAATAVAAAARSAGEALAAQDADLVRDRAEAAAALAGLEEERARLAAGEDTAPPAPHTRSAERRGRDGAPLWRLVDFDEGLAPADRAGLEAALEASGLLDAWVTPGGRLLGAGTLDVALPVGAGVDRPLTAALRPAVDRDDPRAATVGDDVVARVLGGIGWGPATGVSWVAADGRWRLGAAEGAWAKPVAQYVGRGAREAERRRRLAELATEIAAAAAVVADLDARREDVARRRMTLEADVGRVPDDAALRDALGTLVLTCGQLRDAEARARDADADVAVAAERLAAARSERDRAVADLALPVDTAGLASVRRALAAYAEAAAAVWPALERLRDARAALTEAEERVTLARAALERRVVQLEEAERTLRAATSTRDELRDTVGAAVEEVRRRLDETRRRIRATDAERRRLESERRTVDGALGAARTEEENAAERLAEETQRRDERADALRRFAATGLIGVAVPELDVPDAATAWAPDPAVRLAGAVNTALRQVDADEPAWDRLQQSVTQRLKDLEDVLSRHGDRAEHTIVEDAYVVTVVRGSAELPPDRLVADLERDLVERETLLNAQERDLLENHLVREVASHLAERIAETERWLVVVNDGLTRRRSSTGMTLRFRWDPAPDGPAALAEARQRLLRQADAAWTEDDREAVARFLQQQIEAVRAADPGGPWLEHLVTALDYRAWHTFGVERRRDDGRWVPADGPASGGERALAVTIPLFAAASAHYDSAADHAPRLVLLDEAFAGVDDDMRAKCLGMLHEFDLDYVLTSEREWGCYPTVPGLAICQLVRSPGIDAVYLSRWEWDGAERRPAADPVAARALQPVAAVEDSLFDG